MKIYLTLLLLFFNHFSFGQGSELLKFFVNTEVKDWDNSYNQNLFILDTQYEKNFVISDTLVKLQDVFISDTPIQIYEYRCNLSSILYNKNQLQNELCFVVIKHLNKFYRIFGFSKCDLYLLLSDSSLTIHEIKKVFYGLFKEKNKTESKKLFKAIKKSYMQFECENRVLLEFGISLKTTIILPQFSKFSI